MTTVQYDPASGLIVAYGQCERASDGLLLGSVLDAAPLALPGTKRLVGGVIEVTPPPEPTAEEVAREEAEEREDRTASDRLRLAVAELTDAETALTGGLVTTIAALRQVVLLLVRVQRAQLRLLLRRGMV